MPRRASRCFTHLDNPQLNSPWGQPTPLAVGRVEDYNPSIAKNPDPDPPQTPLRPRKDSAMIRICSLLKFPRFTLRFGVGVVAALVLLATLSLLRAQNPGPPKNGEVLAPPSAANDQAGLIPPKAKGDAKSSNLEKTRSDAAELSALADQLRDELNKMNANVLPLDVIKKTVMVEKLAKKIKEDAHGR